VLLPWAARAGHDQVEAAQGRGNSAVGREPVADNDAVEAPFAFQDSVDQVGVFSGRSALDTVVNAVVRRHHAPDACVLHGSFEGCEVDLAQGALVDSGEVGRALGL